jgi:hypothetical protein
MPARAAAPAHQARGATRARDDTAPRPPKGFRTDFDKRDGVITDQGWKQLVEIRISRRLTLLSQPSPCD